MMFKKGKRSFFKKVTMVVSVLMFFATFNKIHFPVYAADYDISENVLSGAVSATVSKDDNNDAARDEIGRALIDGSRESASGGQKTKWFISDYNIINELAIGAYAQFELENPVSVYEITVYSKTNTSTKKPISGFVLQSSMDGQKWTDITEVKGNTNNLCTKRFDSAEGKYFRVVQKSDNEFRVTEIQLKQIYTNADFKNEIKGNDIFNTGRFVNSFVTDVADSLGAKFEIKINGMVCDSIKNSEGWVIDCAVPLNEMEYLIEAALVSETYNIKLWEITETFKVYNYKAFIDCINNNGSVREFKESFDGISDFAQKNGYDTKKLTEDSDSAVNEMKRIISENAPYEITETSVSYVIDIIKAQMPMVSINYAQDSKEIEYSLNRYVKDYNADLSFISSYGNEEKSYFYGCVLTYRRANGLFNAYTDINSAIESAKQNVKTYVAYSEYKRANALTLPKVFEKYKNVVDIDMSFIDEENINQTLFILKTMDIQNYADIPSRLVEAYNMAKSNKESFSDSIEDKVTKKEYTIKPGIEKETTVLPNKSKFVDLNGFEWAEKAIGFLFENGMIDGRNSGYFEPAEDVTREEFAKMVVGAFEIEMYDSNVDLKDVDISMWYYPFVCTAYDCGVVKGFDDNRFGIGEYITKEDMATILYRVANIKGIELEVAIKNMFADTNDISDYALKPTEILHANKIIHGDESERFYPKSYANRAEAAVMIYNLKKFGGEDVEN